MPTAVTAGRASASHGTNTKTEVVSMPFAACNGELVEMSGTVHTKIDFDFNPDGSFKFLASSDYKLSGIGSVTGAKYEGQQTQVEKADVSSDKSTSFSEVRIHLVAQGKVPDTDIGFKVKTMIDDGELKQFRDDFWSRCK
jgi:hypothetical protein